MFLQGDSVSASRRGQARAVSSPMRQRLSCCEHTFGLPFSAPPPHRQAPKHPPAHSALTRGGAGGGLDDAAAGGDDRVAQVVLTHGRQRGARGGRGVYRHRVAGRARGGDVSARE